MANFNIEQVQNVEIKKKLPIEKTPQEQIAIMSEYTQVHARYSDKAEREVECLKVLYPRMFRSIEDNDLIAGRLDFLPIGFGCVTSLGGAGHYCVFRKLRKFQQELTDEKEREKIEELYNYWTDHDMKTLFCRDTLTDSTIGSFIDIHYPFLTTVRLSGMMLDYEKLLTLGIGGLRAELTSRLEQYSQNSFLSAGLQCLDIFCDSAEYLAQMAERQKANSDLKRQIELDRIAQGLRAITTNKPDNFHDALQLFWLYALLSGCINYGRLDDLLGPYLVRDMERGVLDEERAYEYLKSMWTMIENRRTTVNGRVIVGGKGRKHPQEADVFLRIALRVAKDVRLVEPQFTLRVDKETPDDIWDLALDALGSGATYPTIYNDDINVPAVAHGMRVDIETATRYVPFGCTEFVLAGQSTGSPNSLLNLLKLMTAFLNGGIDPVDNRKISGKVEIRPLSEYKSFDELYSDYKKLVDYYLDLSAQSQKASYDFMNQYVCYLFPSLLMDDCIERGKSLLDGGVRYLGGTSEIYGIFNTSDAFEAIRELVFKRKKYSLEYLEQAALVNFKGYESLRRELWECDKYGNDLDTADGLAVDLYEHVAKGTRDRGIAVGMQYFLVVLSNNQMNTEWGRATGASLDGRFAGQYMNPANNPQGGANTHGPTAMLNSLAKIDASYHGGSVQNIKFSPSFFAANRDMIKVLFQTYFARGGSHIMVTVVGRGILEDAVKHPEKYPDLIVRVSGFSAVFVNLEPDIQQELMSRVLYD